MIRLNRAELRKLARPVVLANTPASLFKALSASPTVAQLGREMGPDALAAYFDRITARGRWTEIELGLAYGVLLAVLLTYGRGDLVDLTRLRWGPAFADLARKEGRANSMLIVPAASTHVEVDASPSSSLLTALADPHAH